MGKKSLKESYRQSYGSLSILGERYKQLSTGYTFRVVVLESDLILNQHVLKTTVIQDEFENTYDYLGDGLSGFKPG